MYALQDYTNTHNSDIRRIKLIPQEGKAKGNTGLVDKTLFTGENELYALIDPQTSFWYLKYKRGGLPDPLKQSFTSFNKLYDFVKGYFGKRNIDILEIEHLKEEDAA